MSERYVVPVAYKDALQNFPKSFRYHECLKIEFSNQDQYQVAEKLGQGKYSDVFKGYKVIKLATSKNEEDELESSPIVVKVLKPVRYVKVFREMKILTNLTGGPFIMRLKDAVNVAGSDYPAFITEFGGSCFQHVSGKITRQQLKLYIGQLLLALHYCHIHGIIHRDVKGGNICVNNSVNKLTLLDFGLAEFYEYGAKLHHRVATRHFKSPELLCNYQYYDYSLDVWSTAAMLCGFCFLRQPFFRGTTNVNQLDKIVEIMGSSDFLAFLRRYNIDIGAQRVKQLSGFPKVSLTTYVNSDNRHMVDDHTINFLEACLKYDPEHRPTCAQLLEHAYFDEVRKELVASYVSEFVKIEAEIAADFVSVPRPVLPSYEFNEEIRFPVPVSPNFVAKAEVFDCDRWTEGWCLWQAGLAKRGWAIHGYVKDAVEKATAVI